MMGRFSRYGVVLPIYKDKGDPMECSSYRGIKLMEHVVIVVEMIFEHRIRQQIEIDGMQFDFTEASWALMSGYSQQ